MRKVCGLLPYLKITKLLMEVDEWTGFTERFIQIKSGDMVKYKTLLLAAIPADILLASVRP